MTSTHSARFRVLTRPILRLLCVLRAQRLTDTANLRILQRPGTPVCMPLFSSRKSGASGPPSLVGGLALRRNTTFGELTMRQCSSYCAGHWSHAYCLLPCLRHRYIYAFPMVSDCLPDLRMDISRPSRPSTSIPVDVKTVPTGTRCRQHYSGFRTYSGIRAGLM